MSENNVYPKAAAGEQSANVAPNPSFPKLEESVLDYWEKEDTFQKSIERRPSGDHSQNEFVFFDGPPFANGLPHYGHLLTGYAKDVIPRYQTMKGHKVNRVFGWDTHGLPVELLASKKTIHQYLSWLWKCADEQKQDGQMPRLLTGWRHELLGDLSQ